MVVDFEKVNIIMYAEVCALSISLTILSSGLLSGENMICTGLPPTLSDSGLVEVPMGACRRKVGRTSQNSLASLTLVSDDELVVEDLGIEVYFCVYRPAQEGVATEYLKYLARSGVNPSAIVPRDLVTVKVDIRPVLDFTKKNALIDPSSPFLVEDSLDDLENYRAVTNIARQQEFTGIINL